MACCLVGFLWSTYELTCMNMVTMRLIISVVSLIYLIFSLDDLTKTIDGHYNTTRRVARSTYGLARMCRFGCLYNRRGREPETKLNSLMSCCGDKGEVPIFFRSDTIEFVGDFILFFPIRYETIFI